MGFFGREKIPVPPHPRREPRIDLPLCLESLEQVFDGCVDFSHRAVDLGGDPAKKLTLCYIGGMVRMERVSDYVLRPLAQDKALAVGNLAGAIGRIRDGALYNLSVEERTTMDEAVFDLIGGNCLLLFPGEAVCLSFNTGTEEKRSVSEPENEPPLKGPRDSFVESIRTNTSLVRRRLRAPSLKIKELLVGRQTVTPVDILWIEGLTNPELVKAVEQRIDAIVTDGSAAAC